MHVQLWFLTISWKLNDAFVYKNVMEQMFRHELSRTLQPINNTVSHMLDYHYQLAAFIFAVLVMGVAFCHIHRAIVL